MPVQPEDQFAAAKYFPIPAFTHLAAHNLTNLINELIVLINTNFAALGLTPVATVTMKQLRLAMQNQSNLLTYDEQVSAAVENTVNIYWNHGATTFNGDPLSADIASKLGLSAGQLATLYALASTFPP